MLLVLVWPSATSVCIRGAASACTRLALFSSLCTRLILAFIQVPTRIRSLPMAYTHVLHPARLKWLPALIVCSRLEQLHLLLRLRRYPRPLAFQGNLFEHHPGHRQQLLLSKHHHVNSLDISRPGICLYPSSSFSMTTLSRQRYITPTHLKTQDPFFINHIRIPRRRRPEGNNG